MLQRKGARSCGSDLEELRLPSRFLEGGEAARDKGMSGSVPVAAADKVSPRAGSASVCVCTCVCVCMEGGAQNVLGLGLSR